MPLAASTSPDMNREVVLVTSAGAKDFFANPSPQDTSSTAQDI